MRPTVRSVVSLTVAELIVVSVAMAYAPHWARAAPICRWVDSLGNTHMADLVPDQYKPVATCTDSQKYELSSEERKAADQRREDERKRALRNAPLPAQAASPRRPVGAPIQRIIKRPVEVVTESTDCTTWRRLFEESGACFGPFRTANGATKAEAFDACNVVPNPEPTCGPVSN